MQVFLIIHLIDEKESNFDLWEMVVKNEDSGENRILMI